MKTLFYALLIFFLYRVIKKIFQSPANTEKTSRWSTKVSSSSETPPPYDAANVEDIEFESAKSGKHDS